MKNKIALLLSVGLLLHLAQARADRQGHEKLREAIQSCVQELNAEGANLSLPERGQRPSWTEQEHEKIRACLTKKGIEAPPPRGPRPEFQRPPNEDLPQ